MTLEGPGWRYFLAGLMVVAKGSEKDESVLVAVPPAG
jgi:hypothetical protein